MINVRRSAPELLSFGEAAAIVGVHRSTIRAWCLNGQLASSPVGPRGGRRLLRRDLERFVRGRASAATDAARPTGVVSPAPGKTVGPRTGHRDRVRRRNRRDPLAAANALRSIAGRISAQLDLDSLFEEVIEQSVRLFGADQAGLWRFDGSAYPLRLAAARGLEPKILEAVDRLPIDTHTAGMQAIRSRQVRVLRTDLGGTVPALREAYLAAGFRTICFVPIVFRDEPLGLLVLYHRTAHRWTIGERDLARSFADGLAAAIGTAQLYDAARKMAARLHAVRELALRLNRIVDVVSIGEAIVAEVGSLIASDTVRVYRVDRDTRMCEVVAFQGRFLGTDRPDPEQLRIAVGVGLTGWVAEHGETIRSADAASDPRRLLVGRDEGPESMLLVPMGYGDEIVGVIVLSTLGNDRFTVDDETTLSIFAGFAAQAIVNAQRFEQLGHQRTELEHRFLGQRRLLEVNERLLSTLDPKGVLELIADSLGAVVAYDSLTIYRVDTERAIRHAVIARDRFASEILGYEAPLGAGLTGWVIEHASPVLANDAGTDPRAVQIPGTPVEPEAIIIVPLVGDGSVIGTLNVSRNGGPETGFSDDEFELTKLFAGQASIALRNAEEHGAVQIRADHDSLTSLRNHGAFQRELRQAISAAGDGSRAADRFAVVMMDLDGFKAYNDRMGHPAGDILLARLAGALRLAVREDDRLYRYGGDEFSVILPGADRAIAHTVMARIRSAVAGLGASDDGSVVGISAGVAAFPEDGRTNDELVAVADQALYLAKPSLRGRGGAGEPDPYLAALDATAIALLDRIEPTALLEAVLDRATSLLGTAHGYIYLVEPGIDDEEAASLVVRVGTGAFEGYDGRRMSVDLGVAGAVYRAGRPISIDDYDGWSGRDPGLPHGKFGAVVGVPLTSGASVVGVIGIASGDNGRTFGEREIGALGRFAQLASIALENARLVEAARRGVLYDPVTGLPNRELLQERVDRALAWSDVEEPEPVGVVLLDLDRFKVINESLGHAAGDRLLRLVGQRLSAAVRPSDTVARFGGDELAILLTPVRGNDEAHLIADRVNQALRAPFDLDDREWFISASFGVAVGTPGREHAGDLLRRAEIAMVRSKADANRRITMFEPSMDDQALEQVTLEAELRRALDHDELVVHYQPIVRLDGGAIVGVEALVRWQHPERGLVPPASFIPVAEDSGLIVPLGYWVLETACRQAATWRREMPGSRLVLSVNLSARQFAQPDLVEQLEAILEISGFPAADLELEITESVMMERSEASVRAVRGLRDLGVRLALDDFGTGYSSLGYLRHLPLDALKIDRSFVADLDATPGVAIVRAVIDLAHGLGIDVVAEGIETAAQCDRLLELGCDRGQGFAFSRPVTADRLAPLLRDGVAVLIESGVTASST